MAGFLSIFAASPFKPIQKHMGVVQQCAQGLLPFINSTLQENWEEASENRNKISYLEGKADDLKSDIILNLPVTMFMPVSRQDLIELITAQDRIANKAKDIAGLILGRQMKIPQPIARSFLDYIECSIESAEQTYKIISELDELLTAGFKGHEVKIVKNMISDLDRIEKTNDRLQVEIRAQLFELEKDLSPIDAIFLYKIIDWVGDLADRAQATGQKLFLLLSK